MTRQHPNFHPWPIWDDEDLRAVTEVVKSGQWWCGAPLNHAGEQVWEFQKEFAAFLQTKHAFACTNGTHAIEICLRALGIGLGDEVIVSDWTFLATGAAVIAVNAIPIFCDIDPATFLIDPDQIERLITTRTKAIICVHLGGMPCEMDRIMEIARKHNIWVIEDCAHAHGSKYNGKSVGTWGDCGTFSFQASKVLTAGEGGAITCQNDDLAAKIYEVLDSGRHPGQWSYSHYTYGSDYRMCELSAALLRTQLEKYPAQLALRDKNAQYMTKKLLEIPGLHPQYRSAKVECCATYVFPVFFDPAQFGGLNYLRMYAELQKAGIPTDDCYPPLHRVELFRDLRLLPRIDYNGGNFGGQKSDPSHFPVVERIYQSCFELEQRIFLSSQEVIKYIPEILRNLHDKFRPR